MCCAFSSLKDAADCPIFGPPLIENFHQDGFFHKLKVFGSGINYISAVKPVLFVALSGKSFGSHRIHPFQELVIKW